jgi:hypothetical protein
MLPHTRNPVAMENTRVEIQLTQTPCRKQVDEKRGQQPSALNSLVSSLGCFTNHEDARRIRTRTIWLFLALTWRLSTWRSVVDMPGGRSSAGMKRLKKNWRQRQ